MSKKPIFIHSLFRTGSTYIWKKFRQNDKYHCYYEPFHQILPKVTIDNIETMLTKDFESVNHPTLTQYYLYEYSKFLGKGSSSIPYFKKSFSFDEFCNNEENPDLKKYIDNLNFGAGEIIPVFQFNRTAFRTIWYKENYPGSLNIYLVRDPRDQWQSYFEICKQADYIGFFLMDLLIASVNKDKEDFLLLSKSLPLIRYHSKNYDKENDFYRIILNSYSDEEKYFIFYYIWFKALIENVFNADFIININLLSKEISYRERVIKLLKGWGVDDIDFDDAEISEYLIYPLSVKVMEKIEQKVQNLVVQALTRDQIKYLFQKISPAEKRYFHFEKKDFIQQLKNKFRLNIHKQTIEKMRKIIQLFADEYFEKKDEELSKKNAQILHMDRQIQKILNSYTYRFGKVVVFPLKAVRRIILKFSYELSRSFRSVYKPNRIYLKKYEKKINLSDQPIANFGKHRYGWSYVVQNLGNLHNPNGILLDSFIERTFCWNPEIVGANLEPWIGFIHVPPKVPKWFHYEQANELLFKSDAWVKSLPYCRGLFTLSYYHRKNLESKLDIPINNLFFPTRTPKLKWSWERFEANEEKKIIQVGWWLRKLHAIYQIPQTRYKKIFLSVEHKSLPGLIEKERKILIEEGTFKVNMYDSAEKIKYLPHRKYDDILCKNIVFVYLYDASASNTVIECIVRNIPILINPIEAVIEYLGDDYPLYFNSLEEAAQKAEDFDLVYQAHNYLKEHPIKEKLEIGYFLKSFAESEIYSNL